MLKRISGFRLLIAIFGGLILDDSGQAQEQSNRQFTKAELEQIVAPIALYPDPLLSQVLMASTYPTEVVEAARWSRQNQGLSPQLLEDAMQKQKWDPSVKALIAVPQALQMMSDKLDWTQQLGDAFLAQQQELLAAVQRLRQRAEAAGHLKSVPEQTVARSTEGTTTKSTSGNAPITIESPNPALYYVPIYDPRIAYGTWPHPALEPFYWYPAGFVGSNVLSFAAGVAVGHSIWGTVDWWRRRVGINAYRYNSFNHTKIKAPVWRHDPGHRGNVPYRDARVAQRYGQGSRNAAREAFRGKADTGRRERTGHSTRKTQPPGGSPSARQQIKTARSATVAPKIHGQRQRRAGPRPVRATRSVARVHRGSAGTHVRGARRAGVRRGGFRR